MDEEVWLPVASKPGIIASSLGRIKLPESTARMPYGNHVRSYHPKPRYGTVTRANKNASHSYFGVYNKKFGNLKVHRLVCEAFHGPPPFDRAVVIHINENAHDNRPENLKWGTQKENQNYPKILEYRKRKRNRKNGVR